MIYSRRRQKEDPLYHPVVIKDEQRFWKKILIVDDDENITLTLQAVIEDSNNQNDANKRMEVYTSNNPVVALSEFKPNFYDLLLVDINMQNMNGFELSEKILAIDINVKICFMSSGEINRQALREIYPAISVGCFIRKPVTIDYLGGRRYFLLPVSVMLYTSTATRLVLNSLASYSGIG